MKELYDFTVDLAKRAGAGTLHYFKKDIQIEMKADESPVTVADRSTEEFIRNEIEKRFPADGILGEEFGEKPGTSGKRWILDPIDGTKSFIRGVPLYGTMIALEENGKSQVGAVHFPPLGDTIAAFSGGGCYFNGERCRVSETDSISKATILITTAPKILKYHGEKALLRLMRECGLVRGWSDCYGFMLVARGDADAMYESRMHVWDTAPLMILVEEAGGRFSSLDGDRSLTMKNALASNGVLHTTLTDILTTK